MSAHMKRPHTRDLIEVVLKFPDNSRRSSFVPVESGERIESILDKYGEREEGIDWKIVAKDSLKKHKRAGMVLRGARFRENISQKELAKRSGVSQDNISRIENGKRGVGEKVAKKLAKPLKINYQLLLLDENIV